MKHFVIKIKFFCVPIIIVFISGLLLPPTPRATTSLLFANQMKDSLLINTERPRIIFVGGSNLSFGLNCYNIKDSLKLNPINTAIHAQLGVKYMIENTLQFVKSDDIIILVPEYEHFFKPYAHTTNELLRTVIDVDRTKIHLLSAKQCFDLLQLLPKFSLSKLKLKEYAGYKLNDIYSIYSYNKYGDADAHWELESMDYRPIKIKEKINLEVFERIKEFENEVKRLGAHLYISFPCLDEVSYNKSYEKIHKVERILEEYKFNLLGSAKRYVMPVEMMFNTHYHLNKKGVEYRTGLLIEDYRKNEFK